MTVHAIVNGVAQTKSIKVELVDCPTTDSIADAPAVRRGLKTFWETAWADSVAPLRREQRGFIYRDPTADTLFFIPYPFPGNTPCKSWLPQTPNSPPQSWIIAGVHLHPFRHNDITPLSCHPGDSVNTYHYNNVDLGGPSKPDWESINVERVPTADPFVWKKIPEYILDKDLIIKANPDTPKAQWKKGTKRFPRRVGSCVRV